MEKLTEMQERFVEEFLRNGGDAANAARVAGYSEYTSRNAYREVMGSATVRTELDSRLEELRHEAMSVLGANIRKVVDELLRMGLDPETPSSVRERCLRTALDRAGFGPGVSVAFGAMTRSTAGLDDFLEAVQRASDENGVD